MGGVTAAARDPSCSPEMGGSFVLAGPPLSGGDSGRPSKQRERLLTQPDGMPLSPGGKVKASKVRGLLEDTLL